MRGIDPQKQQKDALRRLILSVCISILIIYVWQILFPIHFNRNPQGVAKAQQKSFVNNDVQSYKDVVAIDDTKHASFDTSIKKIQCNISGQPDTLDIGTDYVNYTIDVCRGKIIGASLKNYNDNDSYVNVLSKTNYINFGFTNTIDDNNYTCRALSKNTLHCDSKNFDLRYTITPVDRYLASIDVSLLNKSQSAQDVSFYGAVIKHIDRSAGKKISTYHTGVVYSNGSNFDEMEYKQVTKALSFMTEAKKGGWLGVSDKYWLTAIIPSLSSSESYHIYAKDSSIVGKDYLKYNMGFQRSQINLKSNESKSFSSLFFVGPKEISLLDSYSKKYGIKYFDRGIDFGAFYIISKSVLLGLNTVKKVSNFNMGLCIIILTILVRFAIFPLSMKSYRSMAKMKKVQPKIKELREMFKNDKESMNKALVDLYRKEKINPLSSLLPLLLQIPIFFSLYKVFNVAIEMRGAEFLWIKDLSLPDHTSLFNLFGLLNFTPSLKIGIMPLLMGITMWVQQKFSPDSSAMSDKGGQTTAMKMMPIVFVFMFAGFPSGLVLYWTINNIFSIAQQVFALKENNEKK